MTYFDVLDAASLLLVVGGEECGEGEEEVEGWSVESLPEAEADALEWLLVTWCEEEDGGALEYGGREEGREREGERDPVLCQELIYMRHKEL